MTKIFKNKENVVLVMLALFSIGAGLWGNFRQLWLQSNGMNVSEISNILSISTLISACLMLVVSIKLCVSKIKRFIIDAYGLNERCIILLRLFLQK